MGKPTAAEAKVLLDKPGRYGDRDEWRALHWLLTREKL